MDRVFHEMFSYVEYRRLHFAFVRINRSDGSSLEALLTARKFSTNK